MKEDFTENEKKKKLQNLKKYKLYDSFKGNGDKCCIVDI